MEALSEYVRINPELLQKLVESIAIFLVLFIARVLVNLIVKRRIPEVKRAYNYRRIISYIYALLLVLFIGRVWISGLDSLTTFLGLASAGLAIAMHDTIANVAGWFFIIWRKPFKLGDRIQIDGTTGDVVDIRFFQFSMVEIGNWVDADQSTGRIVHVPNSKVLREPLANYHIGFEYVWHEIPVLITFESDWKKAKGIISEIASNKAEHLSKPAEQEIRRAAEKFLIFFEKLTPIVYTTVKESGVLLTVRYVVEPRQRRITEQEIWESILDVFAKEDDIELAYPTTRFYTTEHPETR